MPESIMAFASLTFLIIYALKTRRMAESMALATLLAMVLLHRQHFLTGTIDALYAQLSNSSYQFVLCIIIGFGGMITLFQESGALMGFRDLLLRVAKGPKRTLVPPLAFLLVGATVFAVGGLPAVRRRRVLTEYKRERASGRVSTPVLHGFLTRLRAGFLVYYH